MKTLINNLQRKFKMETGKKRHIIAGVVIFVAVIVGIVIAVALKPKTLIEKSKPSTTEPFDATTGSASSSSASTAAAVAAASSASNASVSAAAAAGSAADASTTAAAVAAAAVAKENLSGFSSTDIATLKRFIPHMSSDGGTFTCNVDGNVMGNITGDVTGDVMGNVTGDVDGNVTGYVDGNVDGNVTGNVFIRKGGNLSFAGDCDNAQFTHGNVPGEYYITSTYADGTSRNAGVKTVNYRWKRR